MNFKATLLEKTDNPIVSHNTLRTLIGVLGILLPLAMIFYAKVLIPAGNGIERSISAYYHTQMREVLVCILAATGVFMMTYKGYERRDTIASFMAGMFALGVVFFPTSGKAGYGSNDALFTTVGLYQFIASAGHNTLPGARMINLIGYIHNFMACSLFMTFAIMSLKLFTISSLKKPGRKKRQRNLVYKICGWLILGCIAIIIANSVKSFLPESFPSTFWLEAISLFAFGTSWLVKGEFIRPLNDPKPDTKKQLAPDGTVVLEPA